MRRSRPRGAARKLAACKTLVIWTEFYSQSLGSKWSSPQKRGGLRSTRPWSALVYVSSRSAARFVVEKRHSFTPGRDWGNCEGQPFLASVSFEIMHQFGECHRHAPAGITRSDARPWRRSAVFVVAFGMGRASRRRRSGARGLNGAVVGVYMY